MSKQAKAGRFRHFPVIYYVRCIATGRIKIGTTTCVNARLPKIHRGTPKGIEVLGFDFGSFAAERFRHDVLYSHLRDEGEWFRPGPDLMADIGRTHKTLRSLFESLDRLHFDLILAKLESEKRRIEWEIRRYTREAARREFVELDGFDEPA